MVHTHGMFWIVYQVPPYLVPVLHGSEYVSPSILYTARTNSPVVPLARIQEWLLYNSNSSHLRIFSMYSTAVGIGRLEI